MSGAQIEEIFKQYVPLAQQAIERYLPRAFTPETMERLFGKVEPLSCEGGRSGQRGVEAGSDPSRHATPLTRRAPQDRCWCPCTICWTAVRHQATWPG